MTRITCVMRLTCRIRRTRAPRLVRSNGRAGQTRPRRLTRAGALLGGLTLTATALGACAVIPPPGPRVLTIALGPGRRPDALALDPGGGRAFVADDARATVNVLDLAAGRVVRAVAVGAPRSGAPVVLALDARTHRLFAANRGDGRAPSVVRVLDSRTGATLRTVLVAPGATALAVDARAGHVFVATWQGSSVSMLDARTGTVLRTIVVGFAPVALAADARAGRAFVVSWSIQAGHELGAGKVGVLDTRTGGLVGTVAVGWDPCAVAVDTSTRRAFVTNRGDNTVSVLDARSGHLLRTVAVGGGPCALVVDDRSGRIFVANDDDGTVSVLDARSGALLETRRIFGAATASAVMQPYALGVDVARDRVYMTAWGPLDQLGRPTGSGRLAVLDARDGRMRRTITVGVEPRTVAVDARSGRVTVVESGGAMRAPPGWLARWAPPVAGWAPWLGRIVPRPPQTTMAPSGVQVIAAAGL